MVLSNKRINFLRGFAVSTISAILVLGIFSCKDKKHEFQPAENPSAITEAQIIFHPDAPHRITRKVKSGLNGNVLMAAYESIISFDGTTFKNITKEAGLENCYGFDVLQAKNGDIWIASDQEGVYVIDSTQNITHFTTEDGVGHRRNMCIYEDNAGNIWIGGQGGLTKYDGNIFDVFTTANGLTHNDINIITQDRNGMFWIGTRGNACTYDGTSFKEIKKANGDPFYNVWSIIEDQNGHIWLNGDGLWRYDGQQFQRITDMHGICMYQTQSGEILFNPGQTFNSGTGLYKLTADSRTKNEPEKKELFNVTGTYLGMVEDLEGNIWIGGGDGVWKYNGREVQYYTGKRQN